ncbi:thermospermine synthase ACAULIS5-like [Asparagus officinalis]|uniref:thermospermine synthase ACAULIS5-like n=1 Tax=Asparagus officinalis TaxID=4686 RepID=UPI00098DEC30|nr:thermospermine synthase ACAULIS5-like [Asparagus officinalis]
MESSFLNNFFDDETKVSIEGLLDEKKKDRESIDSFVKCFYNKALVIDGKLQSAEIDEFIYHESLVHPALLRHQDPKTTFIMGGGEGSTAREILRHNTVEKLSCVILMRIVPSEPTDLWFFDMMSIGGKLRAGFGVEVPFI